MQTRFQQFTGGLRSHKHPAAGRACVEHSVRSHPRADTGNKSASDLQAEIHAMRIKLDRAHERRRKLLDELSNTIKKSVEDPDDSMATLAALGEHLHRQIAAVDSEIRTGEVELDHALTA